MTGLRCTYLARYGMQARSMCWEAEDGGLLNA